MARTKTKRVTDKNRSIEELKEIKAKLDQDIKDFEKKNKPNEKAVVEAIEKARPLRNKINKVRSRQDKIDNIIVEKRIDNDDFTWKELISSVEPTKDLDLFDWDKSICKKYYEYKQRKFEELNLGLNGVLSDILQSVVAVRLNKDPKESDTYKGYTVDETLKGLETVLPYIKNVDIEVNPFNPFNSKVSKITGKYIAITEYTLCESGVFFFMIEKTRRKKKFHLMKTTYSRTEILKSFADLREILEHIQVNLPAVKDCHEDFEW